MTRSPPMMMMKHGSSQYNPLYSRPHRPSSPPPTSKPIRRWDVLVLTAGNAAQCHYFSNQLEQLNSMVLQYCAEWYVTFDQHPNMGSGLATAFAAKFVRGYYANENLKMGHVLLIHAGGLSKRLPHIAPFGKVFAVLPNGRTILEEKLRSFRFLPELLSDGLFVASSDTDEKLDLISEKKLLAAKSADIILFGHHSSVQVGTQHGVFILEDPKPNDEGVMNRLKKVLQKPTLREMQEQGAEISKGTVITDSTFFLSQKVAYQLADVADTPLPYFEICCYADFMRPLGTESDDSYIDQNDEKSEWQMRFYKLFKPLTEKTAVIVDEKATFSHFGTTTEFLNNIAGEKGKHAWRSLCDDVDIPSTSFIEFSVIAPDTVIPEYTLLSHVSIVSPHLKVPLPINSTIFTWKLRGDKKFVTIILSNTADIKNVFNTTWFNHPIPPGPLFEAKIFPVRETPEDSLLSTLYATKEGIKGEGMSIKEAIENVDAGYEISRRGGQQW
uniref:Fucokinase domain-containing protein n=1 Tax=Panagrellus redivivus TaxID=6233 RepID=A0A7E4UX44_PANRE